MSWSGADLTLLRTLAETTGGRPLGPADSPFSDPRPTEYVDISAWLVGAALAQVVTACALRVMSLPTLRAVADLLHPLACLLLKGSDDRVIWAIEATGRRLEGADGEEAPA